MKLGTFTAVAALGLAMVGGVDARAATTFNFQFDNEGPPAGGPDGTVTPPLVGSGTFISPIDLTPGAYALSSLPGFSVNFTLGTQSFTTTDIATPIVQVAVDITSFGSGERLVFTENGSPADGGPNGGSFDLLNGAAGDLSFEPSYYNGGLHNLYFEGNQHYFGNYLATSVAAAPGPTPGAGLFGLGLLLTAFATLKARGLGQR